MCVRLETRGRACLHTHMRRLFHLRVFVCVPIPFHLIKPWLQQPHTLVCRTQPFITGLEPFTAGFMGASAGPQGHHCRGRGRGGNGEGGRERRDESRGRRAEGWERRGGDKRRDGGSQSQTGFNLLEDFFFCNCATCNKHIRHLIRPIWRHSPPTWWIMWLPHTFETQEKKAACHCTCAIILSGVEFCPKH